MAANLAIVAMVFSLVISCSNAESLVACEKADLQLSCQGDNVLSITSALYGRKDRETCAVDSTENVACEAGTAVDVVKELCQDHRACTVQSSNSLFDDPCRGTSKYLQVDYQCVKPTQTVVTACEDSSVTLNCTGEKPNIEVLSANYGRYGRRICHHTILPSDNCSAANSLTLVKERCDNKPTCTVLASNSVFDDPCFGTKKYLTATYRCV